MPYVIHTVLTDNSLPINEAAEADAEACWAARGESRLYRVHAFALAWEQNDIEHQLTKPRHPWTNGQVERVNRTLKEATVRRYHHDSHDQLRMHLQLFVDACNHARRLKTLRGLTPYAFVCKVWIEQPERFRINPFHHTARPNIRDGQLAHALNEHGAVLRLPLVIIDLLQRLDQEHPVLGYRTLFDPVEVRKPHLDRAAR